MREAEEHQERMAFQVLVADRLAVLVGEPERAADRRGRVRERRRPAPGDEQPNREAQHEAREERGKDEQEAGGARVHVLVLWRMILSENRCPLFGIMRSKTRRDAGRDDLEEHRRAVVRPQDQRRGDQRAADRADQQRRARGETG